MATVVRWQPWTELASVHNEMSRLMNGLFEGNGKATQSWVPAVDVWETDAELVYAFDLPGIPEDKIAVEVENGSLTVSAEREQVKPQAQDRFYRFERRYGSFARQIGLPQGLTENDIRADYKDGVLELHVTKPKAPEPRKIQIGKGTIEGKAAKQ
jgi:HSP20 family protein